MGFLFFLLFDAFEGLTVLGSIKWLHVWKILVGKSSGQDSWAVHSNFGDWYQAHIIVLSLSVR